jgi:hypothetical protein
MVCAVGCCTGVMLLCKAASGGNVECIAQATCLVNGILPGEGISPGSVLGLCLVLVGIALVGTRQDRRA